jgi:hypothetical protein
MSHRMRRSRAAAGFAKKQPAYGKTKEGMKVVE